METYITLLRGINVSGKNIIKMANLQKALSNISCFEPKTYLQSGNIVFNFANSSTAELERNISECIEKEFLLKIETFVFLADEFRQIVLGNPFLGEADELFPKDYYICFLREKPIADVGEMLKSKITANEEVRQIEKALYLHYPNGYGKSKLDNNSIEAKLKTRASTRNVRTCQELLKMI